MNGDLTSSIASAQSDPNVSIIVRTFPGRLGCLREALESLGRQSYPQLEVIVVEDGGDTAGPTTAAAAHASGRRFIHHPSEKVGRCAAGNIGLKRAAGELLGFLDDDDRLLPDHVASLVAALQKQSDAVAAYAQAWEVPTIVASTEPLAYTERARYLVRRPAFSQAALAVQNLFPIQAVLFRRSLFDAYGGFDTELDNLEDWDLWRRYAAAGRFVAVDRVTSVYRVPGTLRAALARQRSLHAYRAMCERRHDAASTLSPSQRFRRSCYAIARGIANQPPLFALRWYLRNWSTPRKMTASCQSAVQD